MLDTALLSFHISLRVVYDVFIDLSPRQRLLHQKILSSVEVGGLLRKVDLPSVRQGWLWKALHLDGQVCAQCPACLTLPLLTKLRKLVNHPDLLIRPKHRKVSEDKALQEQQKRQFELNYLATLSAGTMDYQDSCVGEKNLRSQKLVILLDLLAFCKRNKHKVLIFSHSVGMLDLIQEAVREKGYNNVRLDGRLTRGQKQRAVDQFNMSLHSFLFLISAKGKPML